MSGQTPDEVADLIQGATAPPTLDEVVADLQAQRPRLPPMTMGRPGMEDVVGDPEQVADQVMEGDR